MTNAAFRVGVVMFPGMTQLDMTGPLEVLSAVPGWTVDLIGETLSPVRCARGFAFMPTVDFHTPRSTTCSWCPVAPGWTRRC